MEDPEEEEVVVRVRVLVPLEDAVVEAEEVAVEDDVAERVIVNVEEPDEDGELLAVPVDVAVEEPDDEDVRVLVLVPVELDELVDDDVDEPVDEAVAVRDTDDVDEPEDV